VGVLDVALPGRGQHSRRALDLVLEAVGARVTRYAITDVAAVNELRAAVADLVHGSRLGCQTAAVRPAQEALRQR